MTMKDFNDYLKIRLDTTEISEIERTAKDEYDDALLLARANSANENAYLYPMNFKMRFLKLIIHRS